jgi:anti-sigma factor (TIGR02949 family)
VTCDEVLEHLGLALDGPFSGRIREEFFNHLSLCARCRREFELETIAQQLVRKSVKHVATPHHVRNFVLGSLREEFAHTKQRISWVERFFGKRFFPSLVTALVVIAVIYYFVPLEPSGSRLAVHTASNDVIFQLLQNFTRIREGQLKPKTVACDAAVIKSYFKKNGCDFAATSKVIDDCDWYGAMVSEFGGVRLAHVVYHTGDDVTYVYEVKKKEALEGASLSMPPAARQALAEKGVYTDPLHPDCNVVVWTANETLCAAVSTMKKDKLLAFVSQP